MKTKAWLEKVVLFGALALVAPCRWLDPRFTPPPQDDMHRDNPRDVLLTPPGDFHRADTPDLRDTGYRGAYLRDPYIK